MTCIVGISNEDGIYLGGDSAGVDNYLNIDLFNNKKVFKNGKFIFGVCGSFRMGQIFEHAFNPPVPREDDNIFHYITTDFIQSLRESMQACGFSHVRDVHNETIGEFMVAFKKHLFIVQDDMSVLEPMIGFAAIGCGAQIALGSLASTIQNTDPLERIQIALSAAEKFSAGVRSPFTIESIVYCK